jgi:hydrogenase/urease accessory protein HupE
MKELSLLVLAVGLLLLEAVVPARADEFKPGYLQLTQLDRETYDVLWKIPAIDEATTLKVKPQFPEGTETLTQVHSTFSRGITVQRWRIRVPNGLDGKAIVFLQLSETRIDVLARLVRLDGTVQLERILPVSPSFVGRPSLGRVEVGRTYTILGIEHILSGFDHLLFVLALVLLVRGTRRLLVTITAFTVAHSLTLAGATLGWLQVPGPPVEAAIALSIVFVASEIVHTRQGRYSVTQHYPWVVAFTFGLLHGFGFAGALAQVGLPQSSIPIALLFFNAGVETGQLMFVGAVLAVIAVGWRTGRWLRFWPPVWLWRIAPYAIGALASFWLVERVAAF